MSTTIVALLQATARGGHQYLGILLTSCLSWSNHIHTICGKARKLTGRVCRHFSIPVFNPHMYVSLGCPHLEYVSYVWNTCRTGEINSLGGVHKFAKHWDTTSYDDMLHCHHNSNAGYMDLRKCTMFKIVCGLFCSPTGKQAPRTIRSHS